MGPLSKISKVSQSNNNSDEKVADEKKVKVEEVKYCSNIGGLYFGVRINFRNQLTKALLALP
jgi:hypothetical protein